MTTTIKALRALAAELGITVDQLDDRVTEYVIEHCQMRTDRDIRHAVNVYREYTEDQVQP